jgi:tetratricopeptide (TPR) repeat protein
MYLPLIAVIALLVIGVHRLAAGRGRVPRLAPITALATVVLALGATTVARNREYSSGLTLAQATLRRWPTDVAHGMVGAELMALHRDDEALPELRLAARSDPRARYNLGAALFNAEQFDDAARELVAMADEYPTRDEAPLARRLAGRAYALQRNWPDAIAQLTLAISMVPGDATSRTWLSHALNGQGLALVKSGKFDEAAMYFRRAAAFDATRVDVRHNLVSALLDAGNAAAAEHEAREAIAAAPKDPESHDLLGRALALQDRIGEAVAQLRRARELAPNDARIRDDLERVLAASRQPR